MPLFLALMPPAGMLETFLKATIVLFLPSAK